MKMKIIIQEKMKDSEIKAIGKILSRKQNDIKATDKEPGLTLLINVDPILALEHGSNPAGMLYLQGDIFPINSTAYFLDTQISERADSIGESILLNP